MMEIIMWILIYVIAVGVNLIAIKIYNVLGLEELSESELNEWLTMSFIPLVNIFTIVINIILPIVVLVVFSPVFVVIWLVWLVLDIIEKKPNFKNNFKRMLGFK